MANRNRSIRRLGWLDQAKGITMLLVIAGHTLQNYGYGDLVRGIIFSFHMPLFFISSGITLKTSASLEQFQASLKKAAGKLLVPALIIFGITTLYALLQYPNMLFDFQFYLQKIYTFLFASGTETQALGMSIPALGMCWFLFVLFSARSLFDFFHLYLDDMQLAIVCGFTSVLGVLLGQVQRLPFSLDVSFAILPFFYAGYAMARSKTAGKKMNSGQLVITFLVFAVILFLTWPETANWTYLELAARKYPLYPLCFVCAFAGTLLIYQLCIHLSKWRWTHFLTFAGRNSIYLFFIHSIDYIWSVLWTIEGRQFLTSALRIAVDLVIFVLFMAVKNRICQNRRRAKRKARS